MPALTQVIFENNSTIPLPGLLIPIPAELISSSQLNHYKRCPVGWSKCPLGYSVYVAVDSLGRRLAIPGIILENDNAKRRKFPNYSSRFRKDQILAYIKPHLEKTEDVRNERDALYRTLTHDLRAISTEIYHEALAAREVARVQLNHRVADAVDLVLSSQQMMSVRLNIVDYESGQTLSNKQTEIEIFKKVEKVFLCFQRKIKAKSLSSSLNGNSYSTSLGPDIIDIAFFVLIENSIKYSPRGSDVIVDVRDQSENVVVTISSCGPCIADNERKKIFERGVRGAAAQRFSKDGGSGIGLYAAATIAQEHFKGTLSVTQESERRSVDGLNYYKTTFILTLPIHTRLEASTKPRVKYRRNFFRGRRDQRPPIQVSPQLGTR